MLCAGLLLLQRQLLAWQLLRELTVHTLAEEEVVYPVVAEQVGSLSTHGSCSTLLGHTWLYPSFFQYMHTCSCQLPALTWDGAASIVSSLDVKCALQ